MGLYTAHWGYDNKNSNIVNLPVSSVAPYNKFTPNPIDRGQPVFFSPGRKVDVFRTVFNGSNLVWTLSGPDGHTRTATASSNPIQRCTGCGDGLITPDKGEHCDDDCDGGHCDDDCEGQHCDDESCEGERCYDESRRGEQCDDGNTLPGDGCNATCQVETGWACTGSPSSCSPSCGDRIVTGSEHCDDGNVLPGDGCSTTCQVESGWLCSGAPSTCSPSCGNGTINASETCDDGNRAGSDGCNAVCQVETGWACAGAPSHCVPTCGDGLMTAGEQCDDGNALPNDGCTGACLVEPGWTCAGVPSACLPTCGDGLRTGNESCDDGNSIAGDGCGITCVVEPGWACTGAPSACTTLCGDGLVASGELCDDNNASNGDGCDSSCQTEPGWACSGSPSACSATCGDGLVTGAEQCDDGALASGDGCSGSCQVEPGWLCGGAPSSCVAVCGDGISAGPESCDDGNLVGGDGCGAACQVEPGWACSGIPSACTTTCGDGTSAGAEQCDDGNLLDGDCCSSICTLDALGVPCGSDGNACTDDACNAGGTCVHSNNAASCDDGNACTVGDVCSAGTCAPGGPKDCSDGIPCTDDLCSAGTCVNPPRPVPPEADFLFVYDTSRSMSKPWKTYLSEHFGTMPARLTAKGLDWRAAIVRFGTFFNFKKGTQYPDVFLGWTNNAAMWKRSLPQLGVSSRHPTEAGSEAINWGLDRLSFRPNAFANVVIYTNEDDDEPATAPGTARTHEPPSDGPACIGMPCEAKWLLAQARIDLIASRLIAQRAQLNLVMRTRDRPIVYQYGDPDCTRILPAGGLDLAATLACLTSRGEQRSLQGQLLSAGACTAGRCSAGWVGKSCSVDVDCSILARAYTLPRNAKQAKTILPGFLSESVMEQSCTP